MSKPPRFQVMDRRRFLKRGIEAGTLIVTLPLWEIARTRPESLLSDEAPPPFLLPREELQKLLGIALGRGGDFAEIYMEHTVSNSIGLDENVVSSASRNVDMGVGFRVLKGATTGYAYSDVLELGRLKSAAETAALVASGAAAPVPGLRTVRPPSYYLVKVPPDGIAAAEKVALLKKANVAARAHDPRIKEVGVGFNDTFKRFAVANSDGLYVEDSQTLTGFGVSCNAIDGALRSAGSESKDGGFGFEHFDLALAEDLGRRAAQSAIRMLPAEDAPAGELPVVIAKGYGGIFFHEAIGHSLEADAIRKRSSCFWDKLGTSIASPAVTLFDDGTWKGGWGSVNVDDEGQPGHKTVLIDKGVCAGFLQDRLSAGILKMAPTGNGRRMSFRFDPIPRMTNTYLGAGTSTPEEIIRSVERGIYVSKIGGGNVSSTTGRFVFEVPEAFLIEGGTITRPLKGIMLMGNGQDILKNITMVAGDLEVIGGGQCGKGGQGKPTGFGNPTFKVTRITVGGTRA